VTNEDAFVFHPWPGRTSFAEFSVNVLGGLFRRHALGRGAYNDLTGPTASSPSSLMSTSLFKVNSVPGCPGGGASP
jgi:hypothetical protein